MDAPIQIRSDDPQSKAKKRIKRFGIALAIYVIIRFPLEEKLKS